VLDFLGLGTTYIQLYNCIMDHGIMELDMLAFVLNVMTKASS